MTADRERPLRLVAGGTALQLDWARGAAPPSVLVDISALPGLRTVDVEPGGIRLGAAVTLNALIADFRIGADWPLLSAALKAVAGPAVRNLATIGGNVAGRAGCLIPALLCLDAELDLLKDTGPLRCPLADWLRDPARHDPASRATGRVPDLIAAIVLPKATPGAIDLFRKVGRRAAFSPSVITLAGRATITSGRIEHIRLATGGGAVLPTRLSNVEAWLAGQALTDVDGRDLSARIEAETVASDTPFATASYRRNVAARAIADWLAASAAGRTSGAAPAKTTADANIALPGPGEIVLAHADLPDRWHVRPDIADKVAGRFAYLTDIRRPDMLVGRILRAGRPHARILSIDTCAAEALPGVAAVVTHRDVGGSNSFGIVVQDQPAFCSDRVRHVGDVVAAVAAVDSATAEAALRLIAVDYEDLPVVTDAEAALGPQAPALHPGGNLQREIAFGRGDPDAAFATAVHVVEDVYVTPRQMHGFMETEGGMAVVEADGTLVVQVGGQHGGRDRMQLARLLGLPETSIRVVTSPTGGAFGGKDELTVQPALALLALKTGRPVRLHLSRAESVLAGQKRNPMTIRMKTACDAEGRLVALEADVLADAGAYASLGPGVLETAMEHAAGPYIVAHVRTRGRIAYTNNGVCGAFRGFGANQMTYAIECQMDRLARLAGLDPAEIRRRNLRRPGMPGYLGQQVAPSERIAEMLETARRSPLWQAGGTPGEEWLTGTGMALNYQGNGLGSVVPDPAGGRLSLTADGRIEGAFGLDEMGQGLLTLIRATLADVLGCGRDDVLPVTGDTGLAPESGSTTASRGASVVWSSARRAAPEFTRQLLEAAADRTGRHPDALRLAPGGIAEAGSNSGAVFITYAALADALGDARPSVTVAYEFPKNDYVAGNARYLFAAGATLARVALSRVTGEVRVLDLVQHTAAGPVMDVAAYLGQIEGGGVQGLGFTLTEDAPFSAGYPAVANLDDYMMPSVADAPQHMAVLALESLDDGDTLGPRGVGELGIGAVTPAIANALATITGRWPTVAPFAPEAMLSALEAGA